MDGEEQSSKRRKLNAAQLCTYSAQRVLGLGSFGVVYQALNIETKDIVAIKSTKTAVKDREVQVMKELAGHPNIVELRGSFLSAEESDGIPRLNLVMEFVADTLHRIIKHSLAIGQDIDGLCLKLYIYQLLRVLNFVHMRGFVHTDIKPQNLLIHGKTHTLKLCDFGTTRKVVYKDPGLRSYLCSRYYRAPELILGSTQHDTSIDVWSAGCVVAEMLLLQPIFTGKDGIHQLTEIFKVLGTPTPEDLWAMNRNYPHYQFTPELPKLGWGAIFPRYTTETSLLQVVDMLLRFDPSKRAAPLEALLHPFFDPLRVDKRTSDNFGPPLLNFLDEELWLLSDEERRRLMPW